ncbi:MAG: DEAD/DEAH box helicase family protein [Lachnospiraceae bacterium]|nr:DEAD/DEAH box helicase family protein [Lachnospiraceae bacterium]
MSNIQFQQDGAENICRRLKKKNRFLLADEVGLGKTITATNIIAKMMKDKQSFRVGYICGNEALAKENIRKLKKEVETATNIKVTSRASERLSLGFVSLLKPANLNAAGKTLDIYTLTPSTTIKFTTDGRKDERAHAYILLADGEEDALLEEVCKGNSDSVETEIKAAENNIGGLNELKNEFKQLFQKSWDECKEKCYKEFVNTLFAALYYKEIRPHAEDIRLIFLERGSQFGKRTKPLEKEEKQELQKLRDENPQWYKEYFQSKTEDDVIEKFENLVKKNENCDANYIKRLIEIELQKEMLIAFTIECLEKIKKDFSCAKCTEGVLTELVKFVKDLKDSTTEINPSVAFIKKIEKKYSKGEEGFDAIKKIFMDVCCKEMMRVARKCMAVKSIDMLEMDLFLADEIQNYSEIFTDKGRTDSEMSLVIDKLIRGEHKNKNKNKIVLMSATPFRYHTKLSELRNFDRDIDADFEQLSVSEDGNNDDFDEGKRFLEIETDVYEEFQRIIEYLNEDLNERESKKWFKRWEELNSEKFSKVKTYKTSNDNDKQEMQNLHDDYKKCICEQSQMLKEAGISRVERYMAGRPAAIRSENETLDWGDNEVWRNILAVEFSRMPKNEFAEVEWNRISDGDILFQITTPNADDEPEWYIYSSSDSETKPALFKADNIASELIGDAEEKKYVLHKDGDEEIWLDDCTENIAEYKRMVNGSLSVRKDYIKSTPAFLSFKQGYKKLENVMNDSYMLSKQRVQAFAPLFADSHDMGGDLLYNARLAKLFDVLFDQEQLHKLLFIPPSRGDVELKGVFKGKRGISKRLFFADYNMTPRSLSVLLSYEAARRTLKDMKKTTDIQVVPGSKTVISIEKLTLHSTRQSIYSSNNSVINKLYEYDEKHHADKQGSPYFYAANRPELFKNEDNRSRFCKAYFKYMTKLDSLRVLVAYAEGSSLYEKIISYGADGCIEEVFDEYFEYIPAEENEKVQMFSDILGVTIFDVSTQFKDAIGTYDTMPVAFAVGHYAENTSKSSVKTLINKIQMFNSPFRPFQFISTSIGQEGFDFHVYCRKIVHWSLEFDPVKFEQREGRINRYQSYANRLNLYDKYYKNNNIPFCSFGKAFEECNQDKEETKGLFPNFVVPMENEEYCMIRECYYYPYSFEAHNLGNVLKAAGYYRALLGQSSSESFEEAFKTFVCGEEKIEEYFINLYPRQNDS